MGSLFETEQNTKSSGTNNTQTQNNLWNQPGLQGFLTGYNQQFSGPNISSVQSPVNAWQTGATTNQAGLTTGLGGAFNTANNIAGQGFAPQISTFMNPYENQVVGNLQSDFARQNAEQMDANNGAAAKTGALGNNTGRDALLMRGAQDAQAKAIANTRMTGFNTAANLANQNVNAQLSGAGQVGNLTGVNTNANQAQFNMGETMRLAGRQDQIDPFQLWNMGLQGQQLAGNLAGTNSNTQSTNNSTTTTTPGLAQSLMGIAGLGLGAYNWGQGNGWWGGSNGGSAGMPSFHAGGAVKGYNSGGSVMPAFGGSNTFADKVAHAHETIQKMRASGGRTEKKEDSRVSQFAAPRIEPPRYMNAPMEPFNPWRTTVAHASDADMNGQDTFMSPMQASQMGRRGYDDGGSVMPAFTPFGGFNPSNTTAMGPAFAGNPFAQFMPAGADGPALESETTGQMFGMGGDPITSSNVMEAYNPNGPPRSTPFNPSAPPPESQMIPTSGPGTPPAAPRGRPLRVASPNEEFAAMLLKGSPISGAGDALLQNHQRRVSEYNAQLQADQLAQQLAHQNATLGLSRDQFTETQRHHQATEEMGNWLVRPDGSMINRKTGQIRESGLPTDVERRRAEAVQMGLDPGEPGYQQYVLTGKLGNTELNATQTNILHHAREGIVAGGNTLRDINRALEINDNAYSGWGAEGRAGIVQNIPFTGGSRSAQDTRELSRLMTGQMLGNLRATFGGNPTEGERAVLAQVEGSVNATPDERRVILTRAKAALEGRMRLQQENIAAIEGRRFTQAGQPPVPAPTATPLADPTAETANNPNAIPQRPNTVPTGALYNPARKQWKAPDGKIYDAEGRPVNG